MTACLKPQQNAGRVKGEACSGAFARGWRRARQYWIRGDVRLGPVAWSCVLLLGTGLCQGGLLAPSPQRDLEQGTEAAKMVEQQMGLYAWPKAEGYLKEVGERLVSSVNDSRWRFSFQIVDQAEPNAFAIPGGGIYVSRGLLALLNREDELAGVLAHEIAHVTQRHSVRQQRKGILPGLLSLPGNLVGSVVGENLGALINAPIDTVGGAWLSRYSRGQESESDRIGIRTAAQSGYDPQALADILLRLDQEVTSQTGQERHFSFFDSHPMTDTRLKDIRSRTSDLTPVNKPRIAPDAAALFAKLDGLCWGENPEDGVVRKNQFLQPAIGFTMTFPEGWRHRVTPQCVVSAHPKQEAILLLMATNAPSDPVATGEKFVEQMRAKARAEPTSVRKTTLGEFPVFVATYLDRSGRAPAYLHFAWVSMGAKSFHLVGLAPEKHRETLRQAALTLRPLTDVERDGITGKRLRSVAARAGERLENLGARSGNVWSVAHTALVNGLDAEAVLDEGRMVKVVREERWVQGAGAGR